MRNPKTNAKICPRCRGDMVQTINSLTSSWWDCPACERRCYDGVYAGAEVPYFDDERAEWEKQHPYEPLRPGQPWGGG